MRLALCSSGLLFIVMLCCTHTDADAKKFGVLGDVFHNIIEKPLQQIVPQPIRHVVKEIFQPIQKVADVITQPIERVINAVGKPVEKAVRRFVRSLRTTESTTVSTGRGPNWTELPLMFPPGELVALPDVSLDSLEQAVCASRVKASIQWITMVGSAADASRVAEAICTEIFGAIDTNEAFVQFKIEAGYGRIVFASIRSTREAHNAPVSLTSKAAAVSVQLPHMFDSPGHERGLTLDEMDRVWKHIESEAARLMPGNSLVTGLDHDATGAASLSGLAEPPSQAEL